MFTGRSRTFGPHQVMAPQSEATGRCCAQRSGLRVAYDAGSVDIPHELSAGFTGRVAVLLSIVGAQRCGVEPGEPVLALARQINRLPGLRFAGLQAYQGRAQHLRTYEERRQAIGEAVEGVQHTVNLLTQDGLECELVSGAGSGTYALEAESGVYNELQAGSYIFMDVDYGKNLGADGTPWQEFEHSLFVYATVMSQPNRDWMVLDTGLKALSVDCGLPVMADLPNAEYVGASDERGKVLLHTTPEPCAPPHGALIPAYCAPSQLPPSVAVGARQCSRPVAITAEAGYIRARTYPVNTGPADALRCCRPEADCSNRFTTGAILSSQGYLV